jgi:hypothetical protein
MDRQLRRAARDLSRREVPTSPGVYAWYRDGEAVYAGRAVGADGLRERVWSTHLKRGTDLSRSSFRRNVCELLGVAPTATTRIRPSVMTVEDVEPVNRWIRECAVTWIECTSVADATRLEKELLAEWMPPLSRR